MQLKSFNFFLSEVLLQANDLQKRDISGRIISTSKYTDSQILSVGISFFLLYFLKKGFSDSFAGYIISFLGIFIGLFTTILISLYEKKDTLLTNYSKKTQLEKAKILRVRNYLIQFTALVSYSIIIALIIIVLLSLSLMLPLVSTDVASYHLVSSFQAITVHNMVDFGFVFLMYSYRFLTLYLLCRFFLITLYSVSSYFYFLLTEYKAIKIKELQEVESED